MPVPATHHVNGARLEPPFPAGLEQALFGLGCFWGAEKKFWQLPGVYTTAVGYAAGHTPNPDLSRSLQRHDRPQRGRARGVRPAAGSRYDDLLKVFWESHDPDAGHAAGQRRRHAVPLRDLLLRRRAARGGRALARRVSASSSTAAGYGAITTEILPAPEFYYAEDYHQQYLSKNPDGYCGLGGTGVTCPVGLEVR